MCRAGFQKRVIADHSPGLSDPQRCRPPSERLALALRDSVWPFHFHYYGDFFSYIPDLARGAARLRRDRLIETLDSVLLALDLDFWGRWHISLQAGLRSDYLYQPFVFSGSRRAKVGRSFKAYSAFFSSRL